MEDKHDGITCLLVEMDSPGIKVRPIKNMAGSSHFAEVFFDNVRVPVENRLGDEGKGWDVTISALAHERSGISEVAGLVADLRELVELAKQTKRGGRPASEHPPIRRRLAKADVVIEGMRLNGQRFLTKQLKGEPLSSETSINKLHRAFLAIELGDLALSIKGSAGQYVGKSTERVEVTSKCPAVRLTGPTSSSAAAHRTSRRTSSPSASWACRRTSGSRPWVSASPSARIEGCNGP